MLSHNQNVHSGLGGLRTGSRKSSYEGENHKVVRYLILAKPFNLNCAQDANGELTFQLQPAVDYACWKKWTNKHLMSHKWQNWSKLNNITEQKKCKIQVFVQPTW